MATDQAESWWLFEWVGQKQVTVRRVSGPVTAKRGSVLAKVDHRYWDDENVETMRRMLAAMVK